MAVTVRTYNIAAKWAANDVLNALQTALGDIGYHTAAQTGTILTFANSAGTTLASKAFERYLVKQSATSGAGTGAVFDIVRSSTGAIATVTLIRGGTGYVAANTLTIQGSDIGGVNSTDDVTITASTVSGAQGSTTTWYDTDSSTFGVCCVTNNATKKLGQTYYSFFMSGTTLFIRSAPGFQSATNVFNGVSGLDFFSTNLVSTTTQQAYSLLLATSNNVALTLTTYQSGLDPNFVIFQFNEGVLYRQPFFLSKYETSTQPWSLDDCFTGGIYAVNRSAVTNVNDATVSLEIALATAGKRQGEWGYAGFQGTFAQFFGLRAFYESLIGKKYTAGVATISNNTIYNRNGPAEGNHNSLGLYNPIIKGLPICASMIPVPYYIPDDFVIAEVPLANSVNYQNTLTVTAGVEVYTVLQFATNIITGATIAFAARTT
jgi:hypothetical protein